MGRRAPASMVGGHAPPGAACVRAGERAHRGLGHAGLDRLFGDPARRPSGAGTAHRPPPPSIRKTARSRPAREIANGKLELYTSGGLRRGTDLLEAAALGAPAVLAGRA